MKEMEKIDNVHFINADFLEESSKDTIFLKEKADVLVSDMAADTTGNKNLDCIRTNRIECRCN